MTKLEVCISRSPVACLAKESDEFLLNYSSNDPSYFVSLTMPVRAKSYSSNQLFPIFEMHLPEGYLLSVIKKHFSKLAPTDDFGLLALLADRVQGRLSYGSDLKADGFLSREMPF
ncbi:HipA N-terminal domain-containing protein [Marinomonas sp. IMCC 4694]|uniref:HipA N-terminal domain-containing protein n=1 Tax=Marinomonas sp. IMCC 4694 TaxID=2605432 RepID=UPI0011E6E724|nr:HipA N-terminal domain-containing protein [Marinomonas sp. IMCC 4694]TYL46860.1 hypothetical protein FXV75_02275 [Marinomonas sp. IMCC 4694]